MKTGTTRMELRRNMAAVLFHGGLVDHTVHLIDEPADRHFHAYIPGANP